MLRACLSLVAGAILSTALLTGPAFAQAEQDSPPDAVTPAEPSQDGDKPLKDPRGDLMTSEQLRLMHSGRDMAGCYLDRPEEITWRERNSADGRLYDLMKGGAEVGRWWVEEGGVICFRYTDRAPGPHCFVGRMRGAYYDFYSVVDGSLVGTTQCVDPEIS